MVSHRVGRMKDAMAKLRREKLVFICLKCGEETSAALASKINPRICRMCYTDDDLDRFRPVEPKKKEETDDRTEK